MKKLNCFHFKNKTNEVLEIKQDISVMKEDKNLIGRNWEIWKKSFNHENDFNR